jgi:hypothetical protein
MDKTYRQRSGIREQQIGADRMLFDDASNSVHVLNGSAAFIWDCLREPLSPAGIRSKLDEEYDLSAVRDIDATIARTLQDFLSKGLILN